ncbi:MAG: AraC family transcriptional regulator [Cyanobacteria bacterium J06636_16]
MAIRFLNRKSDYLHPGSPNDARLFHSDVSDQIQIWSSQVGQGYSQTIPLRDDLSLIILDYEMQDTLIIDSLELDVCLEFSCHLAGKTMGQSAITLQHGLRKFGIFPAQQRVVKVEVFFQPPSFGVYCHAVLDCLPTQEKDIIYKWVDTLYQHQFGHPAASPQAALDYFLNTLRSPAQLFKTAHHFTNLELSTLSRLLRPMNFDMYQVIHQILSCPYGGHTRRTYLEGKALELVALQLNAIDRSDAISYPLNSEDLGGIYQAGKTLAYHLKNPPSVDTLARQVGLNRLKLNCGFHYVYGTTPYRYLRNCRLTKARELLLTLDLGITEIADRVGYTSRSSFSTAFHQQLGLSPKTFQLYSRNHLTS